MTLAVLSTAVSRSLVYLVLCSSLFVGGSREPGFLQLPSRQPVADANKDPCTPKQVSFAVERGQFMRWLFLGLFRIRQHI
jgi:hypothetical protein